MKSLKMEKWENPRMIGENVLPAHSSFCEEETISLNGSWRFKCFLLSEKAPISFERPSFDDSSWSHIAVPGCWETEGHGQPWYYGAGFPPALSKRKRKIPLIDHSKTFTGIYRRHFAVSSDFLTGNIRLRFGSVKSAFYCWINGTYVGMGKGSMLPVEFDISNLVQLGENTLAVQVFQFSDGTYLEGQDMWFLSGIYRDVLLIHEPQKHILDVHATAEFSNGYSNAILSVSVQTSGVTHGNLRIELEKDGQVVGSVSGKAEGSPVSLNLPCENVKCWSAEKPDLYVLRVTLEHSEGQQAKSIDFGFREISIDRERARLLINGKPLKLFGMNYHAFSPEYGYFVSAETYERDLKTMKQFNINAIRTSHYPQDDYFYSLCDRYGLYVMDECNVETHGVRDKNVPGDNPLWTSHVVDRMERMVLRDRNHPSVVIWSLGNESSIGSNHFRMRETAMALDPTRPIHYEGGSNLNVSDFLCDGYSSPQREQQFADGKDVERKPGILQRIIQSIIPLNLSLDTIKFEDYKHHPIVATEYGHCMGQSGTELTKHAEIFDLSDRWCGGFIWDYKDKALRKGEIDGKPVFAYGGDFGVRDQRGDFCCNGATDPEGRPHSVLYEIQKAYQPIICRLEENGTVSVYNRNSFTATSNYRFEWSVTHDGISVDSGILSVTVSPRGTKRIAIPHHVDMDFEGIYHLSVRFSLMADTPWAPAGHVCAYEQWTLRDNPRSPKRNPVLSTPSHETIEKWFRPVFFRAVTDADAGFFGLALGKEKTVNAKLNDGECTLITTAMDDGSVLFDCSLKTEKKPPVRFGMQAEFPKKWDRFEWFGRGPNDTYFGREDSGIVGIHRQMVTEQDEHIRPQEHGNKREVRWLKLTNESGEGIRVDFVDIPLSASVWPYSLKNLQEATHIHELPEHKITTLNVDFLQNGLGDCFVPCPREYKLQPHTEYRYRFIVSRIWE